MSLCVATERSAVASAPKSAAEVERCWSAARTVRESMVEDADRLCCEAKARSFEMGAMCFAAVVRRIASVMFGVGLARTLRCEPSLPGLFGLEGCSW